MSRGSAKCSRSCLSPDERSRKLRRGWQEGHLGLTRRQGREVVLAALAAAVAQLVAPASPCRSPFLLAWPPSAPASPLAAVRAHAAVRFPLRGFPQTETMKLPRPAPPRVSPQPAEEGTVARRLPPAAGDCHPPRATAHWKTWGERERERERETKSRESGMEMGEREEGTIWRRGLAVHMHRKPVHKQPSDRTKDGSHGEEAQLEVCSPLIPAAFRRSELNRCASDALCLCSFPAEIRASSASVRHPPPLDSPLAQWKD